MNRTAANARSTAKGWAGPVATAAAYITLCAAIGVQMPFFPAVSDRARAWSRSHRARDRHADGDSAVGDAARGHRFGSRAGRRARCWSSSASLRPRLSRSWGSSSGTTAILLAVGLAAVVWSPVFALARILRGAAREAARGGLRPVAAVGLGLLRRRQSRGRLPARLRESRRDHLADRGSVPLIRASPRVSCRCSRTPNTKRICRPCGYAESFAARRCRRRVRAGEPRAALRILVACSGARAGCRRRVIGFLWSLGTIAEIVLFFAGTQLVAQNSGAAVDRARRLRGDLALRLLRPRPAGFVDRAAADSCTPSASAPPISA